MRLKWNGTIIIVTTASEAFFPLDERWGLNGSVYSAALAKQMVWLSGLLPYAQCQQVFERIGERCLPVSSLWRQTQYHAQHLRQQVEAQRQHVSLELVRLPTACHDHQQAKGIEMDGGMVNLRGEGWRELKVGAVFNIQLRLERDAVTEEWVEMPHAEATRYTAVLGKPDAFAAALWKVAVEQEVATARHSCVCGDAAAWIWALADDYFPNSRQIVDWFHACDHLAQAAQVLYPDDEKQRHKWLNQQHHQLFKGQAVQIAQTLEQAGCPQQATYFFNQQRRMQYLEFREEGWPIGSGVIESSVKQFKSRLSGAGMRWNREALEGMIIIRAAVLGHDFDTLWAAA